jgi:hypothetical protein
VRGGRPPPPGRYAAPAGRPPPPPRAAGQVLQAKNIPDGRAATAEQELEQELLLAERHAALREAFADLPPDCQRLLALLIEDPGCHTTKSVLSWASPLGASTPTVAAAWTSCAATRPLPP